MIVLAFLILTILPALAKPVVYENWDHGFRLTHPDSLSRAGDLEQDSILFALQDGSATLLLSIAFDEPGRNIKDFASDLQLDPEDLTEMEVDGATFYRGDVPDTTPGGVAVIQSTFFSYDSESGSYIYFLVTTESGAPDSLRETLFEVVKSFEFLELPQESGIRVPHE